MAQAPAEASSEIGKRSLESTTDKLHTIHTILPQAGSTCNNILQHPPEKSICLKWQLILPWVKMFGICKKGSIVFSSKLFLTYEQAGLFTIYTKNVQVYFLGGGTDLKFRKVEFYLII